MRSSSFGVVCHSFCVITSSLSSSSKHPRSECCALSKIACAPKPAASLTRAVLVKIRFSGSSSCACPCLGTAASAARVNSSFSTKLKEFHHCCHSSRAIAQPTQVQSTPMHYAVAIGTAALAPCAVRVEPGNSPSSSPQALRCDMPFRCRFQASAAPNKQSISGTPGRSLMPTIPFVRSHALHCGTYVRLCVSRPKKSEATMLTETDKQHTGQEWTTTLQYLHLATLCTVRDSLIPQQRIYIHRQPRGNRL